MGPSSPPTPSEIEIARIGEGTTLRRPLPSQGPGRRERCLPGYAPGRFSRRALLRLPPLLVLAAGLAAVSGCRRTPSRTARTEPMESLLASGRAPVAVTVVPVPGITPLIRYPVRLKNLSDLPVVTVRYTVLFYGPDGVLLPAGKQLAGFANAKHPIAPGGEWEGAILSDVPGAARAASVVREVGYAARGAAPGAAPALWTNPRHDTEVGALETSGRAPSPGT